MRSSFRKLSGSRARSLSRRCWLSNANCLSPLHRLAVYLKNTPQRRSIQSRVVESAHTSPVADVFLVINDCLQPLCPHFRTAISAFRASRRAGGVRRRHHRAGIDRKTTGPGSGIRRSAAMIGVPGSLLAFRYEHLKNLRKSNPVQQLPWPYILIGTAYHEPADYSPVSDLHSAGVHSSGRRQPSCMQLDRENQRSCVLMRIDK